MRKSDKKKNMEKANLLAENMYIESKKQLNEEIDNEPRVIGQEGKNKVIANFISKRDNLIAQRDEITKEIIRLNREIKKWEKEISANQLSLFSND